MHCTRNRVPWLFKKFPDLEKFFVFPWLFPDRSNPDKTYQRLEIFVHLTGMICLWAGNLTTNFRKMSNPHTMPYFLAPPSPPTNTAFTLIGNVVPCQLTRGRDNWPQMVHFCLRLTVFCILINFDLHNIRK